MRDLVLDMRLKNLYSKNNITEGNYYLVIGRFVPENNYETILAEYMKSKTDKDLVIISNITTNKQYVTIPVITCIINFKISLISTYLR